MLKRFFLSIIILSALASSESGVYFSAGLFDYYLVNMAQLDLLQDNNKFDPLPGSVRVKEGSGTPAAFYKVISQNAIEGKSLQVRNNFQDSVITVLTLILAFVVAIYLCLNNKISFKAGQTLLHLTDSSPPAFC